MMENSEKIIAKIKKVLELSKNNPSEEEAKSAALKAQKLMAEYHISMSEVEAVEDINNIVEKTVNIGTGNKWKYTLAGIISKNFRCKHFYYGKSSVVFYGHEVDAVIAAETFKFLFETGNKAAISFYNKLRNEAVRYGKFFDGTGIKNSFLIGYLEGIKEELEKQCTALMIVVPKEVEEKYSEKTKEFRKMQLSILKVTSYYGNQSREEGRRTGKNAICSKQLAMA